MKTPSGLQPLIDDGVIDEVMRPLKSGKEAAVYVVRAGDDIRCAKVYKDMAQRSFQQRVQYQEGRKVRGSREARAIGKASKYGRKQQEKPGRTPRSMRCTSCARPACACRSRSAISTACW
jgi:RIO kinase 1